MTDYKLRISTMTIHFRASYPMRKKPVLSVSFDGENREYKDFGENPVISDAEYVEYDLYMRDNKWREDPILIEVVEELGERASSHVSHLVVVEIPDGLDYVIDDYDGFETLHERVEEW